MGRVRAYRRIGTVNGIEVHQGTTAHEIGFEGGDYMHMRDFEVSNGTQFIARTPSGELGGLLVVYPDQGDPKSLTLWWLEALEPDVGYGRKLVRAMEHWARINGFDSITLNSRSAAYGFWVKMGYYLHPETVNVILENRDLFTGFSEEQLDAYMTEVEEEGTIPDALFEEHPGALPDPILMEKDLR